MIGPRRGAAIRRPANQFAPSASILEGISVSILNAILLGLVQGIAEFLPISSSGHLSVLQNLFHMSTAEQGHLLFDVMLHVGTLISILIVYWRDLRQMVRETIWFFQGKGLRTGKGRGRRALPMARLVLMLVFATLPLVLILPVKSRVETLYYHTFAIGLFFLLTGCILYVSDHMPQGSRSERNMTVVDALLIGLCQCVATIPGVSRSGVTITAGMARGLDREFAVKFSFLLSIPAVVGSALLTLIDAVRAGVDGSLIPAYLIGTAVSALVGVASIRLLQRITRRGNFGRFCYYLWGAGIITIILTVLF